MRFKSNDKGTYDILKFGMVLCLLAVIGLVGTLAGEKAADVANLENGAYAWGSVNFTDRTSTAEMVNVTVDGVLYCFELNTSGTGVTTGLNCLNVYTNTTTGAAGALNASLGLTTKINGNTTLASLITATRQTNAVSIEADNYGTAYNDGFIETIANGTTTNMSGGLDRDHYYNASDSSINAVESGYDLLEVLVIALIAGIIIALLLGIMPFKL